MTRFAGLDKTKRDRNIKKMIRHSIKKNEKNKQQIISSINIGDLIRYCPEDMPEMYHDYGIIISINEIYRINSKNIPVYEFNILWQKDNRTTALTSNHVANAIIKNSMILYKHEEKRSNI